MCISVGLRVLGVCARGGQQLMDEDLLGTRRFAVVRDDFDQHQVRAALGGACLRHAALRSGAERR